MNRPHRRTPGTARTSLLGVAAALATVVGAAAPALAQREAECASFVLPTEVPEILRLSAGGAWDPPANFPSDLAAAPIAIPVTVHVVRKDDGTGGLAADRIVQSFADLNAGFDPVDFHFYKCGPTRYIDSTQHWSLDSFAERDELTAMQVVPNTINLYYVANFVAEGDSYCGMASFTNRPWQGVIIVNECAGVPNNKSTVPHEFGHYFDLYHTHETSIAPECADGSNCATAGDLLCDTPADPKLDDVNMAGCVYVGTEVDPCGDPYAPDPSNLMCYAPKQCRTEFTPGQISRMRATLFNLRPNLIGGGCASTLGSITGSFPSSGAGGPAPAAKPVLFARRACDAASGPCRTAGDGGTTDDFITASIDVTNSTPATLRLNLRIEADLSDLVPGGSPSRDVTRFFRPLAGGSPIENPMTFPPGTTTLELDVKKAIGRNLVNRFPANVPFVVRLEAPGARGLVLDFSVGVLGFRPAAGYYDDCVVEENLLPRDPVQAGDALVVRFDAQDLPDPAAGWDVRGVEIVGGEVGGSGLSGLPLVELRLEDPANPGQPDMTAAGLLRSAGPVAFGAAPATAYADFADLVHFPPAAGTPDLFVLAYLNPGDSLGSAATAIAASSGAEGAVLVGNSSALLGGATPLAPIAGRDLMIRLDLGGELSD